MHLGGLAGLVTGYKVNPLPAAGFVASFEMHAGTASTSC
jgi:hypothetical protein